MSTWLHRLRESIADRSRASTGVRHALACAQREHGSVELVANSPGSTDERPMCTTIEELRDDSFVIALPVHAGVTRQLTRFGLYTVTFDGPGGRLSGQARALARTRVRTMDGRTIPGFRLELPSALHAEERRNELRALLGGDLATEGELRVLSHPGAIYGVVEDLSAGGARIRCRNAPEGLHDGARGIFLLDLPEPIGQISEMVRLLAVEALPDGSGHTVRVQFRDRNQAIADALGDASKRRAS